MMNKINRLKKYSFILFCSVSIVGCDYEQKKDSVPLRFTWEINENKPLEVTNVFQDNIRCDSLGVYPGKIYQMSYGNGKIMTLRELGSDSTENGLYLEFHPEGTVYLSGEMRDGKAHGHWKSYSHEGILLKYTFLEGGEKIEELIHPKRDSIIYTDLKKYPNFFLSD